MKLWKRMLLCSALVLAFTPLACNRNPSVEPAVRPATEPEKHTVEKGLHTVEKIETDNVFVSNGASDYTIVYDETNLAGDTDAAAVVIRQNVAVATGAQLSVKTSAEVEKTHTAANKYIVIGVQEMFESAELTMPTEDIGNTGCYVVTKDNSVYIMGKAQLGTYTGALRFIEQVLGYRRYSNEAVTYTVGRTVTMPQLRIVDRPDFEYPEYSGNSFTDGIRSMGYIWGGNAKSGGGVYSKDNNAWHNSFTYIRPEDVGKKCTFTFKGEEVSYDVTADMFMESKAQLCYSGGSTDPVDPETGEPIANCEHGDKFDTMTTIVAQQMYEQLKKFPELKNYAITAQDARTWCTCAKCAASKAKYGVDSATVIKFCNEVARKLNDVYYAADAKASGALKRTVNVMYFAYQNARQPAVKKNGEGKYVPFDDGVKCRPDTSVMFAPIEANYVDSFYDDSNANVREYFEGWSALTDNLFVWLYETNFSHYMYPFNTWENTIDTYRYCRQYKVAGVYNQGQFTQYNCPTGFTAFKEYLDARAMNDVTVEYAQIKKEFFENYFMDASDAMLAFFDELVPHMHRLEQEFPELNGNIYCNIAQAKLWPRGLLTRFEGYIADAYAAIEKYRDADPALYARLEKYVTTESMFPRYALIDLYPTSFTQAELAARKTAFKSDVARLGISNINEHNEINSAIGAW